MEQNVYDYRATQEIKQIVIGVQELRCRKSVEKDRFANGSGSQINWLEEAKQLAKHELLKSISDFILVKEIRDGFYVEAELYLPYIRDSAIEKLERTIKANNRSLSYKDSVITALKGEIEYLNRPWWKKLFKVKK